MGVKKLEIQDTFSQEFESVVNNAHHNFPTNEYDNNKEQTIVEVAYKYAYSEDEEFEGMPSSLFPETKLQGWESKGLTIFLVSIVCFAMGVSIAMVLTDGALNISPAELKEALAKIKILLNF